MLGNFSIGDYFKEDALKYVEILTIEEYDLGFDKERLYVTVYPDDHEAYDIWVNKIGINRLLFIKLMIISGKLGRSSGPDSEIFMIRSSL